MKISYQLHLNKLAADGAAPIHLTIICEGNRLRVGTSAVVRPEHWDWQHGKGAEGHAPRRRNHPASIGLLKPRPLLINSRYMVQPSEAARAKAEGCKVDTSTVYRALRIMEQQS
jgi:hypothetical protein